MGTRARSREHIEQRLADLPGHIANLLDAFRREENERGKVFRDPPGVVRPVLTVDTASAAIVAPIESFFATAADKAIDAQHRACARRRIFLERLPMPMHPEHFKMLSGLVASIAEPAIAVNFFPALDPAALARLQTCGATCRR